jgi:hypothetical protein
MSKRLLNLVITTHELKGAAYQVMLALAWNASVTNECSISISDLAADAHLTKQAVIRALHSLSAPDATAEGRSILTRVRKGRGTGMPATYLINIDLMRDLNRRRRYRLATEVQRRGTGVILILGVDPTTDGNAGNLAALVEHPLTRTLTGEISPNVFTDSGFSNSQAPRPLSQREVNKILKASAKQEARDIWAMVNGTKEIVLANENAICEAFEVAASPREDDKPDAELSGEPHPSGENEDFERPHIGIGDRRRHRPGSQSSREGGIRWPRRVRW